jgi:homoserine kinase
MYLEVQISIDPVKNQGFPLNCKVTYEGLGKDEVSLDADRNLLTRVAL